MTCALVLRQITPAVGDEFITTTGEDENGQPLTLTAPNPDYVPPQDTTLSAVRAAVENAGVSVFKCFESGDAPEGQARVAFQIEVGDDAEAERRDMIDLSLAEFAP